MNEENSISEGKCVDSPQNHCFFLQQQLKQSSGKIKLSQGHFENLRIDEQEWKLMKQGERSGFAPLYLPAV